MILNRVNLILICLTLFIGHIKSIKKCPTKEIIAPCKCEKYIDYDATLNWQHEILIQCSYVETKVLKKIFSKIGSNQNNRHFDKLKLYHNNSIENDTFGDVIFDKISIPNYDTSNKFRIDKNAFKKMEMNIKEFEIDSAKMPDKSIENILTIVDSLKNAQMIYIAITDHLSINKNFTLPKLKGFYITSEDLSINDYAFYHLERLNHLELAGLNYIPSNLFNFKNKSNSTLAIFLNTYHELKSLSFGKNALSHINRPTYLRLKFDDEKYLSETTFRPFLEAHYDNTIDLKGTPIDCNDCRSYWLNQYKNDGKITNTECYNGDEYHDFFDHDWSKCKKSINETIGKCPKDEAIAPCDCQRILEGNKISKWLFKTVIKCKYVDSENISKIFSKIGSNQNNTHFNRLELTLSSYTIESHTFGNVIFEEIKLGIDNLSKIDINAFEKMENKIKEFEIKANIKNDSIENIFTIVDSFKNAEKIVLDIGNLINNNFTLTNLKDFYILNNNQLSINDYAFYDLDNLIYLKLFNLNYISSNLFNFKRESNSVLVIDLKNNHLNSSSFGKNAFSNINHPTELLLWYNNIEYLSETIFRSFLEAHSDNTIDLNHVPINCNDCRSLWLNQYKSHNRIINAKCHNGKEKFDFFKYDWNKCKNIIIKEED